MSDKHVDKHHCIDCWYFVHPDKCKHENHVRKESYCNIEMEGYAFDFNRDGLCERWQSLYV